MVVQAVPCPVCRQAEIAEEVQLARQIVVFFGRQGFQRCPYCCLHVEHPDDEEYVERAKQYVRQQMQGGLNRIMDEYIETLVSLRPDQVGEILQPVFDELQSVLESIRDHGLECDWYVPSILFRTLSWIPCIAKNPGIPREILPLLLRLHHLLISVFERLGLNEQVHAATSKALARFPVELVR